MGRSAKIPTAVLERGKRMLDEGKSTKEVASKLRISARTVRRLRSKEPTAFNKRREGKVKEHHWAQIRKVAQSLQETQTPVTCRNILLRWKSPVAGEVSTWTLRRVLTEKLNMRFKKVKVGASHTAASREIRKRRAGELLGELSKDAQKHLHLDCSRLTIATKREHLPYARPGGAEFQFSEKSLSVALKPSPKCKHPCGGTIGFVAVASSRGFEIHGYHGLHELRAHPGRPPKGQKPKVVIRGLGGNERAGPTDQKWDGKRFLSFLQKHVVRRRGIKNVVLDNCGTYGRGKTGAVQKLLLKNKMCKNHLPCHSPDMSILDSGCLGPFKQLLWAACCRRCPGSRREFWNLAKKTARSAALQKLAKKHVKNYMSRLSWVAANEGQAWNSNK
jgi:transposase